MLDNAILISGGAGYIGSHTIRALQAAGYHHLIVVDDLSSGIKTSLPQEVRLYEGDIADEPLIDEIIRSHGINTIMHFAAKISVLESVENPQFYYSANTEKTARLIDSALRNNVGRFIFSSTAAVYGDVANKPVSEDAHTRPTNPYGRSKLASEWYLEDRYRAANRQQKQPLKWAALRYFNVAGAHVAGGLGQYNTNASHLIKMCCKAAKGELPALEIYGDDYSTQDGTCIRDYIHVDDLATAHVAVLNLLERTGASSIYNVGYGSGYSVQEVIETFQRVNNVDFAVKTVGRRAGDSVQVIADASKLIAETDWQAKYDNLELICRTAWNWDKSLGTCA